MKPKNGFIATSLIYSFFLVFLMIMLASVTKDAQTRQLLRTYKDDVKAELNSTEFIVITLPKEQTYNPGDSVDFVGDIWQVVENKTDSIVLILARSLSAKEITEALETTMENAAFFHDQCNSTSCSVRMCMPEFSSKFCFFKNDPADEYDNPYNWKNSIAKEIVEKWLENNVNLQKICRSTYNEATNVLECKEGTSLMKMTFSDGIGSNTGYIRLATQSEIASSPVWVSSNPSAWTLTNGLSSGGVSSLYSFNNTLVSSRDVAMQIRPVIEVQKS